MVCVESRSRGEQEGASRSREQEERMLKHVLGTVVCRARLRWKEQPMATVDCNFFFFSHTECTHDDSILETFSYALAYGCAVVVYGRVQ